MALRQFVAVFARKELRGDDGNIVKWYSTIHDIEDRKRSEANLRQSESELRASEEQWRDQSSVMNPSASVRAQRRYGHFAAALRYRPDR